MKKKWLGFNKVLLGFSMAGGFIVSIVAAVVSSKLVEKNEELGFVPFVVFLAGALLVFGFHALWGLLVEAAGNLASLPEEMAKRGVSYSAQRGSAPVSGQTSAPVSRQLSAPVSGQTSAPRPSLLERLSASEQTSVSVDEQPSAPVSGRTSAPVSERTSSLLARLSAPANEQTSAPVGEQTSVSVDDTHLESSYWRCPGCGKYNYLKYSFCRKCGTAKKG